MRLAVYTMGHTALGEEKERRVIIIHLSSGCCCRQWEVKRDKRYEMSVTFVLGPCVTLYRIRVSYEEGGREGGREELKYLHPKTSFIPPSPARSWQQYMQHISET